MRIVEGPTLDSTEPRRYSGLFPNPYSLLPTPLVLAGTLRVMPNAFKAALLEKKKQIGLWLALADAYSAELCATAGFDWLLIDGEHAPNDLRSILAQLQAIAPHAGHPVVRPPIGEVHLIKQLLDIGAHSLLIPMIETAEQAALMVAATRYPSGGLRGVGSAIARASEWSRKSSYMHEAGDEVCLIVQVETVLGLKNLEAIASTPGVDGVFIGPADLAASMGHLGNIPHPEVQAAVEDAIRRILAAGKAAGILTTDDALNHRYLDLGCTFVAVGVDVLLLANATRELAAKFKSGVSTQTVGY